MMLDSSGDLKTWVLVLAIVSINTMLGLLNLFVWMKTLFDCSI